MSSSGNRHIHKEIKAQSLIIKTSITIISHHHHHQQQLLLSKRAQFNVLLNT